MNMEMVIGGIAVIPLLIGLGEVLKKWGVEDRWVIASNMVVAVVIAEAAQVAKAYPNAEPYFIALIVGLGMALAANGLYSVQKKFRDGGA